MDNRQIVCQGHTEAELHHALAFAMADHERGGAIGFRIDGPWLVFYWYVPTPAPKGYSAFISALSAERLTPVVWHGLVSTPKDERPPYPTHDGSSGDGFRLETDCWGHAGHDDEHGATESGTFCRVRFEWAWYGK